MMGLATKLLVGAQLCALPIDLFAEQCGEALLFPHRWHCPSGGLALEKLALFWQAGGWRKHWVESQFILQHVPVSRQLGPGLSKWRSRMAQCRKQRPQHASPGSEPYRSNHPGNGGAIWGIPKLDQNG